MHWCPTAHGPDPPAVPEWLNKGDNAWQLTAATFIGIQTMPGLVILYGGIVKKKWAVNSAFMALYAFPAGFLVWVIAAYRMAFGERLLPFWGKAGPALSRGFLGERARIEETVHVYAGRGMANPRREPFIPMATLVHFEFMHALLSVVVLAGSVLGRMSIKAWMAFAPLWLVFSYTVGAFSLWGGGFLEQWGVLDYAGGFVIHVSAGISGLTAAYWVGPRLKSDREHFSPNNILMMLAGAGLLWTGFSSFNGGAPNSANLTAAIAVVNTNISAATSLLTWTCLDVIFFQKPSVIGAIQGVITGAVCITPGAGLVHGWSALVMGVLGGSVPWFTMMILHKKSLLLQQVDDTLAVFHTHAVAGALGGFLTGLLADPKLCLMFSAANGARGMLYGGGALQVGMQLVAALLVAAWNALATTAILLTIRIFTPLRMPDDELIVGDDAAHGEEAYALWGDGEKYDVTRQATMHPDNALQEKEPHGARGITVQL